MITVHHLNNSRSQRVLWLLEGLGLPYEIQHYQRDAQTMLAPPELLAVHPLGKSPVITDTSDGRRTTVAETGAIVEYILDRHGGGRLRPAIAKNTPSAVNKPAPAPLDAAPGPTSQPQAPFCASGLGDGLAAGLGAAVEAADPVLFGAALAVPEGATPGTSGRFGMPVLGTVLPLLSKNSIAVSVAVHSSPENVTLKIQRTSSAAAPSSSRFLCSATTFRITTRCLPRSSTCCSRSVRPSG